MTTTAPSYPCTDVLPLLQKKVDSAELHKPLRKFISSSYGEPACKEYETALLTVQQLRSDIRNVSERSEIARDLFLKYYVHLSYIATHFPVGGTGQIKISFTWYDSFSKKKLTQTNINYEQLCVLWNAAAICSQIGAAENRATPDGPKVAAKYFQQAAGIFDFLRETVAPRIVERVTPDVSKEILEILSLLMLAYSQQCFYEKARQSMKDEITAKLAAEAAAMYREVESLMLQPGVRDSFDKTWLNFVHFQSLYFECRSQTHMAKHNHDTDKIGEELSRLQRCQVLIKEALSTSKSLTSSLHQASSEYRDEIDKNLAIATRDNEKVYHDRVMPFDSLPAIDRKRMAKPFPVADLLNTLHISDMFVNLIPVPVLEAKSQFNSRFTQRLQAVAKTVREHRDKVRTGLAQLNLPGAILACERREGIPVEVWARVERVQQHHGGVRHLTELLKALTDMANETRSACDSVDTSLKEEENEDRECRDQFGQRWPRLPSAQLTVNLKKQLADFRAKIQLASQSDRLIQSKIDQNKQILDLLERSKTELDQLMPHDDVSGNTDLGKAHAELKSLLAQIDELHSREEALEQEIADSKEKDDVQGYLLRSQDNLGHAVEQLLAKYESRFTELQGLLQQVDGLMQRVQVANTSFVSSKQQNQTLQKREQVIQNLVSGANKFEEINANLKEGMQFYTSMQELIQKLKQRCDDFAFARKTEKLDIITNLQQQATGVEFSNSWQQSQMLMGQQSPQPQQPPTQYPPQYAPQYRPQYAPQQHPPQYAPQQHPPQYAPQQHPPQYAPQQHPPQYYPPQRK